eukprot:CAMPEP_0116089610 /NCGR_PEP_ID=MMETSP0327-20121206/6515_1 /TAXON_ID=44447 /ORGANISM="Pseudo-nitzschia delicatissima, Strain B596" /LENGTH=1309 /DNA_ID=CAMNT_0003580809 /DNA_START=11 /DNA_END=3940 /DNA_ORIENTATION=-
MSTTEKGYIIDLTDHDDVAMIPAPPSEEMDNVNQKHGDVSTADASVGTSRPSSDSVSAAIALVRAKQMAKSAILRAEEQNMQPRSFSSDQTATSCSGATESSSLKDKVTNVDTIFESENEVPTMSTKKENNPSSSAEGVTASSSEIETACSVNTSIPPGASFEQTPDQGSVIVDSPSDAIPAPPSFGSNESGDPDVDGTIHTNTIDGVNAFLSRLGVGALNSASNESIDKLRVLSSGASGTCSDGMISQNSAPLEVQPQSLAEISQLIDFVREEHSVKEVLKEHDKLSVDTTSENKGDAPAVEKSWLSPIYEFLNQNDPQSTVVDETEIDKVDPPKPSHEENPFINHSFSGDSVEDEKKTDESNDKNVPDEDCETRFGDESFAADVRKTLSTVQEVASMEADDDDSTKEYAHGQINEARNSSRATSSLKHESDNVSQSAALSVVSSGEQESVYGADGRKEPKGGYEKAKVEVEKIPVSNIGVEHAIHGSASLESQGFSDNGSLPWAIRDVASEETLRATGRRRPQFVVSGPRPSHRSRNAVSLFDDTSQQASETASEFRSGLSFLSDKSEDDNDPSNAITIEDDDAEIEESDSVEDDTRCMIDAFLYNKYEPENEYPIERGTSSSEQTGKAAVVHPDKPAIVHADKPVFVHPDVKASTDSCDLVVGETGEVEAMNRQQSQKRDHRKLEIDQSTEQTEIEKKSPVAFSAEIEDEVTAEKEIVTEEESNPFLRQFEALDLNDESDDEDDDDDVQVRVDPDPVLKTQEKPKMNVADGMSPEELASYFSNIDQLTSEGENNEKLINDFKALMMPVMDGKIPTIIEEAQIRQAALKANIPLGYVDKFIDHVKYKDEKLEIAPQLSKEQPSIEKDFVSKKSSEEIDDLDEDGMIAAFLSPKDDCQDLKKEEVYKPAEETSMASVEREEKAKELTDPDDRDNEHSATSTVDREVQGESDFKISEDVVIESDLNTSRESEVDPSRREEESDREVIGSDMSVSNGDDELKLSGDEKIEKLAEILEPDPVDIKMLRACESIERYDEGIWQRRAAMATHGWEWEEKTWLSTPQTSNFSGRGIHSVTAARDVSNFMFNKRSFPLARRFCKHSYKRRVKPHKGYFDVDMFSLQQSAACGKENMFEDETPWELRQVRQRFLHEHSLTFSRNWFGDLVKTSGNDKIKAPTCKPKSMEMPMRKIPDPGDWTPEWYTTWNGRKLLLRRPSFDSASVDSGAESGVESGADSYTDGEYYEKDSLRSYSSEGTSFEDDEDYEEFPECGTFKNTKLKIGEHVSRVHPDYTSSLRKSRWRKKYFPIGTFPY